jgi:hypothetical protein
MKRIVLFIICSITLLVAQAKPPAYSLKDPAAGDPLHAVWVVKVQSLSSLQTAIISVVTLMDWKILVSTNGRLPMPAFSLSAVRYPSADPNKRQGLDIDVDMDGSNASLMVDWRIVGGPRPKPEAKQFYDEFFLRLAQTLK